jgi:hypothetical protein
VLWNSPLRCAGRETLRRALLVTIVRTRPEVMSAEVLEEVAHSFNVDVEAMTIHHIKPEDFLLFLPNEESASKVFNGGNILRGPRFILLFKCWSRFPHASSTIMSNIVVIEIHGIPEHAWFRSTAEIILKDSCCIIDVHPNTLQNRNLSFFVKTCCFDPEKTEAC